ncbi:MAG: hypothetical protein WC222_05140 [Parachlamydiales bacterium]|jgi:hypothetical protein
MKKLLSTLLCAFAVLCTSHMMGAVDTAPQATAVDTRSGPLQLHEDIGTLTENGRGYIYLKVDDNYIKEIFPLLDAPDYTMPPYFRRADSPGAHISVFYEEETKNLPQIAEVGKKFTFTPESITTVNAGRKRYIILRVNSPELEALRTKYGLKPLLQGHPFHISIAVQNIRH